MTIVTGNRSPKFSKAMKELSKREGSPCPDCVVTVTCRRSFIDQSACQEFAEFVQNEMIKAGMLKDEDQE